MQRGIVLFGLCTIFSYINSCSLFSYKSPPQTPLLLPCNDHIGKIDLLMLTRYMHQIGYKKLLRHIEQYQFFSIQKSTDNKVVYDYNPYVIKDHIAKDTSELSSILFEKIEQYAQHDNNLFQCDNYLNKSSNSLDHCSQWEQTEDADTILCITRFYDKKALKFAMRKIMPKILIRKELKQGNERIRKALLYGYTL